ncbi:MAG: hypothetical protein LQ338_000534 [Usnochroma carphineum]|nr:MAG: hypothetical protein LQ338_000534 [Usnochroma carphineum]
MDRYGRPLSPGGRRVAPPGRSSTGALVYPSSFDPYYAPTRSSRDYSAAAGPRTSAERVPQPRPVPRYRPESPPPKRSADDYVVRPRRLTLDPDAAERQRPVSVLGPSSPNRSSRPVITTSDRPSSPLSKASRSRPDEPYYLQPASSTHREHRRNYSVGSADPGRDGRERTERGGYRSSGIGGGRSGYELNQPLVRQSGDRDRGGYEYTDRREQMYRDTEPRPRPRRDSYTGGGRERPLSMTGLEDYLPRVERTNREAGPPVSTRGFGAIGRSGSLRQGPSSRDYDLASDFSRDDYERRKAHIPRVALHQDPSNPYVPIRDDDSILDDARDRRQRKTMFEDEIMDPQPLEGHDDQYERIRRAKAAVDEGKSEVRHKDRYPKDYDKSGEEKSRRHHQDRGRQGDERGEDRERRRGDDPLRDVRDERDEDRNRRRRDDAMRDARAEDPRGSRDEMTRDRRDENTRERRDDGHMHRRADIPREKRYHGDRGIDNGLVAGGAAAATGLAAAAARSHQRHRGSRDERDYVAPRESAESTSASTVSREESDDERRDRHRRRRERRGLEEREARELTERERRQAIKGHVSSKPAPAREPTVRDPDPGETLHRDPLPQDQVSRDPEGRRETDDLAPPKDNAIREQPPNERPPYEGRIEAAEPPASRSRRHRHHSRSKSRDSYSDSSSASSASRRPRNVRVVTPTSERAPSPPPQPKSILRPPREKFPEDPAPVREGVAPLKDAGKKGIPPNARWTKIDRKLVNPEALEAGNERYEERVDYVIVLRVLTKEEIEQYAAKTQELRAARAMKAGRPEGSGMPEWG